MSDEAMFAALKIENQKRCDPPLPEAKVAAIAASVARYPAGPAIVADVSLVKQLADRMMLTEHLAQEPGVNSIDIATGFTNQMEAPT